MDRYGHVPVAVEGFIFLYMCSVLYGINICSIFSAAAGNQDPYVDPTAGGEDKKEDETPQKKPAAESDEDAEKNEVR